MNEQKLSYRLERVCAQLPENARFADIGSDHAYLPCYAILQKKASFAVAGEVVKGPYQSACQQVEKVSLKDVIDVRLGNGLEVVKNEDNLTAITIAGMGGPLIASILEDGKEKLSSIRRLILQPNVGAHAIRNWLMNHYFAIINEEIIEEDGKIYEIIVAEPTKQIHTLTEKELYLGKLLIAEKNEVFIKKWQGELEQLEKVKLGLDRATQSNEVTNKLAEVTKKMAWIKEVIG